MDSFQYEINRQALALVLDHASYLGVEDSDDILDLAGRFRDFLQSIEDDLGHDDLK